LAKTARQNPILTTAIHTAKLKIVSGLLNVARDFLSTLWNDYWLLFACQKIMVSCQSTTAL